jgi:uncharacterized protein DUF4292
MPIRIFFLLIILLFIGCSSPRYTLNKDKVSFSELLNGIEEEQNKIYSINGESRISIETSEFSGNFFADILYNENDSLLINVSGPFGIGVGKLFLGKNRFIFLNQFANQFYSGDTEGFKNRNFLQLPLKIHEMSNFFTGKELIKNMKILDYDVNDDMFYIKSKDSNFDYNIWIDSITGRIKKIEYLKQDKIVLIKEYDKFFKFDNTYFPKHIKLSRPEEKQVVSVYYNRIIINQKIMPSDFIIKISDTARQIDLNLIESAEQENL